jgi:hypothetical protein
MSTTLISFLAHILGWFVILTIPGAFFAFGWKDIELNCHRHFEAGPPSCTISESFAMGLYTRSSSADNITHIGYRTSTVRQPSSKAGFVTTHTSTIVFQIIEGEIPIGHVTSAVDSSTERELILKTRAFLDSPTTKEFSHKASMHGLFGYVGFVGVVGLLFIFIAVCWHHIRKAIS